VEDLNRLKLLTDSRYRELRGKYGHMFEADTGAQAILTTLQKLNLDELHARLHEEINSASGQRRKKAIKRLQVVEPSGAAEQAEWMIITVLRSCRRKPPPPGAS